MADEVFMRDFREFLIGARCRSRDTGIKWTGVVAGVDYNSVGSVYVIGDDGKIINVSAEWVVLDLPNEVLAAITGKEYK
jgi:hypothetical protein